MKVDSIIEPVNQETEIKGPLKPGYETVLSEEALAFIFALQNKFNSTRIALLKAVKNVRKKLTVENFRTF